MSILIKGMEMPVTCCQCKEMVYNPEIKWEQAGKEEEGGWVCLLTGELIDNTKREEHCPLIEVPTPHGRLIDADDFDSRIRAAGGLADEELTDDFKDGVLSVLTLMKTQNTVIEAEK